MTMSSNLRQETTPDANLMFRPLAPVYAAAEPYALPLLRIVTGLWLLPHGVPKIGNFAGTAEFLGGLGYNPSWFWTTIVIVTEVIFGLMLAAGFLTRLAALFIFIHLLNVVAFHWGNGFSWSQGGWEYPGLWAVAALVFLIRGGGYLSVDRAIGREI